MMRRVKFRYEESIFPVYRDILGVYSPVLSLEAGHSYVFRFQEWNGNQRCRCIDRTTGRVVWDDPPSRQWPTLKVPEGVLVKK